MKYCALIFAFFCVFCASVELKSIQQEAKNAEYGERASVIIRSRNIGDEEKNFIVDEAFRLFEIFPNDRDRVIELSLTVNEELILYCPIRNRWNVLSFNECGEEFILSNPSKRFIVFTYKRAGDLNVKVYAVYNECEQIMS